MHSWDPSARETLFDDASSPADNLQTRFGARTVSTFTVKYPATLGRFNVFGSAGSSLEGTEAATYGESVRHGRDVTTLEMETVARHCPGTRFVLIGYSQGAHLIGDAAAETAGGRVPGVGPDDIAAVVLFADPARAPLGEPPQPALPSRLYAPPPHSLRGRNFETVQPAGTVIEPTREALKQSGLSLIDATVVPQIALELQLVLNAAHRHAVAASPTPAEQQAAIAVLADLPELAKEGVTWPWLLPALDAVRGVLGDSVAGAWYEVLLEVFRAVQAVEQMHWRLERVGVLPRTPTGTEGRQVVGRELVVKLCERVIDAAGLRAAYDHPANAALTPTSRAGTR